MDTLLKLAVYSVAFLLLLLVNVAFVQSLRRAMWGREVVIAPFHVVGREDADGRLGAALAYMLQARLASVSEGLEASQRSLTRSDTAQAANDEAAMTGLFPGGRSVAIPTALLEPVNVELAVGGVEVGGVFSWLQRRIARPRMLTFAVNFHADSADGATVAGSTMPLIRSTGDRSLWIQAPSSPEDIVDRVAHELLRRTLAADRSNKIGSLDVTEFETLVGAISTTAALNDRSRLGRPVQAEFQALFPSVDSLAARVPNWAELAWFAAEIAERAELPDRAVALYESARAAYAQANDTRGQERVAVELRRLRPAAARTVEGMEAEFVAAAERFAAEAGLAGPQPEIRFVPSRTPGMQVMWNDEERRMEVNPDAAGSPGLAEYTAVMGRFMARNYRRCFGRDGATRTPADPLLWNDFRLGLTAYVLSTFPGTESTDVVQWQAEQPLGRALKQIEEATGNPLAVRTLALQLLERFECNWTRENLPAQIRAVNQDEQLLPDDVVAAAFAGTPASSSGAALPNDTAPQPAPPRRRRTRKPRS